jgi:GH18 family chitinase
MVTLAVRAEGAVTSMSAWDASDFRIWGYIPYWATSSQINSFATNGLYTHMSDVLYFGGLRPDAEGDLTYAASSYATALSTLRTQAQTHGFKLHLSMFEVTGGQTDATWESIIANPTYRQNFVTQVKNVMLGGAGTADDIQGFNFDWERPSTATEWGNYTQLARELRTAFKDPATPTTNNWEISVCDFGSTDSNWDATTLFDAKVYDQLFIMVYHIGATSSGNWANTKKNLTQQGAAKAFSDDQIAIGVGTYGTGPSSVSLSSIVSANPNLAYDAGSYTGTIGSTTGTWTIESRKQVREKTQLALDRGMPGMFSWTIHYDTSNNLGLHRVMHHYTVVKRNAPDVNLDGKINATDATTLANNMGITTLINTGMATAAQFDDFYLRGNWEKGDHDANGFVNQVDADWLAARYTALGVTLPDRLAYSGTFENFTNSAGVTGRWRAGRNAQNALVETSNFAQNGTGFLSWNGTGVGAAKRSNSFVTIRNQNSLETTAGVNSQSRTMQADLATAIDLAQEQDTYVTFLVRENTAPLSAAQLSSVQRTLSLDFLNSAGATQFNLEFRGLQQSMSINSVADTTGQDVVAGGMFGSNATYLVVGKISGNGSGANKLQASIFGNGAVVADFTNPDFQWALTAEGSAGFNPLITDLQFTTRAEANYTVSNLWVGNAATIMPPTLTSQGDFNRDGVVDSRDYVVWRNSAGQTGASLAADANGNYQIDAGDLATWRRNFGQAVFASGSGLGEAAGVPEPGILGLVLVGTCAALVRRWR